MKPRSSDSARPRPSRHSGGAGQTSALQQIRDAVHHRARQATAALPDWPCRKGCDDCCRNLASPPRVSLEEWIPIAAALDALPAGVAESARRRIRESASESRPVVCPLLDTASGSCLVYHARPVACRAYGFYAERQFVRGCARIESIGQKYPDIVWGNHTALEENLHSLGAAGDFATWLADSEI